ncbi:unnamed protein product [Cuscuta campestris]|uniref:Uncharacterized protein n=1 Tax=Cuscuta campestris TaxID=132261 RepID=A0A484KPT6_9ASTE|nr:unnamed protein product [Cuscuta campestris]
MVGKVIAALCGGCDDVLMSLAVVEVNKATMGAYPHVVVLGLDLLLRLKIKNQHKFVGLMCNFDKTYWYD